VLCIHQRYRYCLCTQLLRARIHHRVAVRLHSHRPQDRHGCDGSQDRLLRRLLLRVRHCIHYEFWDLGYWRMSKVRRNHQKALIEFWVGQPIWCVLRVLIWCKIRSRYLRLMRFVGSFLCSISDFCVGKICSVSARWSRVYSPSLLVKCSDDCVPISSESLAVHCILETCINFARCIRMHSVCRTLCSRTCILSEDMFHSI